MNDGEMEMFVDGISEIGLSSRTAVGEGKLNVRLDLLLC